MYFPLQQRTLGCGSTLFPPRVYFRHVHISYDYSCVFVLQACHNYRIVCVCVCGHYTLQTSSRIFMASLFIAAQNNAQLKTHDIIRMTDNIVSADKVISM